MKLFVELVLLSLTTILANNYVLVKFLGICPFLGVSKKVDTAVGMSLAVTFVMVVASVVTFFVQKLLVVANIEYMQTVAFILVIAVLVQVVEMAIQKFSPALYSALGIYLPLITTNCAVLGVVTLNIDNGYNFVESLICAIGGGVGFLVAMVMFAGVRSRLESCDIPKFLKGLPITLVAASLVSLSFLGFAGVVENIFA